MIGWMPHDHKLEMPSQSLQWQSGFLGKNLVSLLSLKFTVNCLPSLLSTTVEFTSVECGSLCLLELFNHNENKGDYKSSRLE